jgi:O-antigen ligase
MLKRIAASEGASPPLTALGSGGLAAATAFSLMLGIAFSESLTSSRLLIVLLALLLLQVLLCPRLLFCRECLLYGLFVLYLFVSLAWAPDGVLGMNTLFPALDFFIVLLLMGSLVAFHDIGAVLWGLLIGFWAGALLYSRASGFPFVYPEDFSYNSVALMYLFGLQITLTLSCLSRRFKWGLLALALLCLMHIAATTSIKTNLGIALGALGATILYFRNSVRILARNALPLVIGVGLIGYVLMTNQAALEAVQAGAARVAIGVDVLLAREDQSGYQGFDEREYWMHQGLDAWRRNPLFGNGVEAFRSDFGITSHSTPVDLLYNTGVIGFCLFYGMFASLVWRLLRPRDGSRQALHALVFAGILCYSFVTLSGTVFYASVFGAFFAINTALIVRSERVAAQRCGPGEFGDMEAEYLFRAEG